MGGDKLLPAVAGIAEDSEAGKAVVSDKKAIFSSLLPALQSTPGARTLVEHLTPAEWTSSSQLQPTTRNSTPC